MLERLRLEVRVRLLSDLAQSLAWLHANPRLMAAHPHLLISPSTIVIGLDGVARVDVRAAKKQESDRNPSEADYVAPELLAGESADQRADIYSLGVLAWEALAGQRVGATDPGSRDAPLAEASAISSNLPLALGSGKEREPIRRMLPAGRRLPNTPQRRSRLPPPLLLPEQGEWAQGLAALALQAMCADPDDRLQDCRPLLLELEQLSARLAATHEIAEVVQGISGVGTLCVPPPTLPDVDATCQSEANGALGFIDRNPCCEAPAPTCAQRQVAVTRQRVEPPAASTPVTGRLGASDPPDPQPMRRTVKQLQAIGSHASNPAWLLAVGLLALAVLGLFAGYVASTLAQR